MTNKSTKRLRRTTCAVALALCTSGCDQTPADGAHRSEFPPIVVQTIDVHGETIPRLLIGVGSLQSPQTTEVSAEVDGTVTFLDIPQGELVEEGRVLARIDDRRLRAMLAVAEARHGNAKEKYDRVAKLQEDGLISRQELDDASAELKEAVGELNDAQTALRQTEVRAPFAGEVGLREISLGAYVSSGERIVQLTQTDPLRLVVGLPQRSVASLRVGQQVRGVAGDCTERFRGQLSVIDPTLDVATRSVRFQARIPNPEGQLRPGMSARVAVEIDQIENAITVPQEAVIRRGTKTLVYTVEDDGSVGTREIVLGQYFVDRVEVASGLRINEKVIVAGHQKLRPDSRIDPQPFERVSNANLQLGFQSIATACEF